MEKIIFETFIWNILDFNVRNIFLNSEIFYPELVLCSEFFFHNVFFISQL